MHSIENALRTERIDDRSPTKKKALSSSKKKKKRVHRTIHKRRLAGIVGAAQPRKPSEAGT
eukprot:scaffold736_cov254-Pinguiococcus_pyrenoidosus.AAC.9